MTLTALERWYEEDDGPRATLVLHNGGTRPIHDLEVHVVTMNPRTGEDLPRPARRALLLPDGTERIPLGPNECLLTDPPWRAKFTDAGGRRWLVEAGKKPKRDKG